MHSCSFPFSDSVPERTDRTKDPFTWQFAGSLRQPRVSKTPIAKAGFAASETRQRRSVGNNATSAGSFPRIAHAERAMPIRSFRATPLASCRSPRRSCASLREPEAARRRGGFDCRKAPRRSGRCTAPSSGSTCASSARSRSCVKGKGRPRRGSCGPIRSIAGDSVAPHALSLIHI